MPRINLNDEVLVGLAFFAPLATQEIPFERLPREDFLRISKQMHSLLGAIVGDLIKDDPELLTRLIEDHVVPTIKDARGFLKMGLTRPEAFDLAHRTRSKARP